MSPSSMRCEPKPNLSNALSKFRALTRLAASKSRLSPEYNAPSRYNLIVSNCLQLFEKNPGNF